MELLQTIWHALTTENEVLANILTSPLIFLEAFIIMLLFTTIFKIETNTKQKMTYVLVVSILGLFYRNLIPDPYGTIINIISMIITIKLIFKISLLKCILSLIFPMIIMAIVEFIISNTYTKIMRISFEYLLYIPIHKLTATSSVYITTYLVYRILKISKINLKILDTLSRKNKMLLIVSFSIASIIIILQTILTTYYSEELPFVLTFLSILTVLSYLFVTIIALQSINELEITNMNLEETKLYNKTLSILHDNIRGFKHDFNNIVQAIGGYINTNDMNGLKQYYSQLQEDCQKDNNLSALNPDSINNPAIYSILASKYHKADELGIKVNLEIFLDLNKLNMKIYEFTRILGILLDNAIEATSECTNKTINVYIRNDFNIKRQLLIIENTYSNKSIDTEKIFEKGYSTKEKNTGLGLWEVRQILKKNSNLNLFTSKDNKMFKQQLEIY